MADADFMLKMPDNPSAEEAHDFLWRLAFARAERQYADTVAMARDFAAANGVSLAGVVVLRDFDGEPLEARLSSDDRPYPRHAARGMAQRFDGDGRWLTDG